MAQDDLVGNMDSEKMIHFFEENNLFNNYNKTTLAKSLLMADSIFTT